MHLARFPRARFAHLPTPLEPMPRLSAELGGLNLWVKRDDCTGLAGGGNKTRKLEFLLGEALAQGADTLVTQGAVQSNHVRQTAAAAARHGMACEIILEERVATNAPDYNDSGNVLLDRLMGGKLRNVPAGSDMNAALEAVAEEVRARGGKPYVIPGGGSEHHRRPWLCGLRHRTGDPGQRPGSGHRPDRYAPPAAPEPTPVWWQAWPWWAQIFRSSE